MVFAIGIEHALDVAVERPHGRCASAHFSKSATDRFAKTILHRNRAGD
jgi:hypothetical protein